MMKPLEWSEPAPPTEGVSSYDHVIARTPFGEIRIEWKSWKKYDAYCVSTPWDFFHPGDDLEDAKAAAQADLTERVASLLTSPLTAS
jgi:hypothetical protein